MSRSFFLHCRGNAIAGLCWLILALPIPLLAQTTAVSFTDALRLADQHAPMLQARQSQLLAEQQEAARAAALPDPKLTLGIANLPVTGANAFDSGAEMMTMKQIGLWQEVPAGQKRDARQAIADQQVEQARALSLAEQLAVRQAAAQAWIAVWTAQQELHALQDLREPAAIAVTTAKARLTGGSGSANDVLAAQGSVLELENRIDTAEAAVTAARAGLARWLQQDPEALQLSGQAPLLTRLAVTADSLLASVDQQQPLLGWDQRQAVAEAEVSAAIAQKRPDWSIGLSYGQRERSADGLPRSDMLSVAVAVDLPLFSGNRQDRGIAARRADLDAVAAAREHARRGQIAQLHSRLARWQSLCRQVQRHEQQALPLANDRSRTALASYAGGGSLEPWLQARRAEIELHVSHARMLDELGQTWAWLAYLLPQQGDTHEPDFQLD